MNLADHLRPLLRDHDCVIIPDFGGLVAETVSARVQPGGRHQLSPPSRRVAFNQALTRNDGLLVDTLSQQLGLPAAEAREALRQAVATLCHELQARQRTELPGIGVFRQLAGRGLQFEYTGTENLLPAAFGLPELTAHPVRATDARVAREQQAQLAPRLRSASRGWRLRRVVPGAAIGLLAGLAVAGLYLLNLHPEALPAAWQSHLPRWEQTKHQVNTQQAALAQPSFTAPVAVAPAPEPVAASPEPVVATTEPTAPSTWDADPEPTPPQATQAVPAQAAPKPAAPAKAAPASATPAPVAVAHPAPAPHAADPVDALLAAPSTLPSPIVARPRGKRKLPAAAAIAVANESNIARPVPMAQRKAGSPVLATSYAAVRSAPAVPKPTPPEATAPAPEAAKVVAAPVAAKPAAHPAAVKPAAPVVKAAPALKPAAPVAKAAAPAATSATTINARTGRYYVVVAAYNSLAHAQQGLRNLQRTGHAGAKIILPYPGTRFFRLSAADYADRPMAQFAASELRKTPQADKGLTVFPY